LLKAKHDCFPAQEVADFKKDYFLTPDEIRVIKNMYRAIKHEAIRQNKKLLLLGRDTWLFYVLAVRDDFKDNTIFDPRVSRAVVKDNSTQKEIQVLYPPAEYLLFDTGFMGSIPRTIGYTPENVILGSSLRCIQDRFPQVFDMHKGSRYLMFRIEDFNSFWHSGTIKDEIGKIWQPLHRKVIIRNAEILTYLIYTDNTPKKPAKSKKQKGEFQCQSK
jgi:hypothetical protein